MNLTSGIQRLRFHAGYEQARPVEPDRVYCIEVTLFPTANRFMAGHRVRVDVSSSNFPHFDVNPNTGAAAAVPADPVTAVNRLHFGRDRPSGIVLHLLPAPRT